MSFEKYRVHEVAKDFGKQTKDITQILTTYATTPKNHMQVLDDKELSIIFEYLTQHNQVADLQAVFATRTGWSGSAFASRAHRVLALPVYRRRIFLVRDFIFPSRR